MAAEGLGDAGEHCWHRSGLMKALVLTLIALALMEWYMRRR